MKTIVKLTLILTAICVGAGLLLAWVYERTDPLIKQVERDEKIKAIAAVLPEHDNEPSEDVYSVKEKDATWVFYVARREGAFVGTAFETITKKGYGGDISVMVGVDAGGAIHAIRVIKHKETPGLGSKITAAEFLTRFTGRDATKTRWTITKDAGDIAGITAATISSRAVVAAVKSGLDVYVRHAETIAKQGTAPEPGTDAPPTEPQTTEAK